MLKLVNIFIHIQLLIFTFFLSTFVKPKYTIMHTRLKQFLAAENLSQAQFADRIKIGKANISHVLAGRNKPGYEFITAIMSSFPQLNINWLFFGTGKMYGTTPSQSHDIPREAPMEYEPDLLFANFDDEPEEVVNIEPTVDIKNLDKVVQSTTKQRVVSKIIILFDDGTYQEL